MKPRMTDIYAIDVTTIEGNTTTLAAYRGQCLLIVNTASRCGYTPQFGALEALYERYKDDGLCVLGFPCNQFRQQDPGENSEIATFCQKNYGVTFPMFAKLDVNGASTHPLFRHLKREAPGVLGTELIKWNFTKFLVDRDGRVVARFAPNEPPEALAPAIQQLLTKR